MVQMVRFLTYFLMATMLSYYPMPEQHGNAWARTPQGYDGTERRQQMETDLSARVAGAIQGMDYMAVHYFLLLQQDLVLIMSSLFSIFTIGQEEGGRVHWQVLAWILCQETAIGWWSAEHRLKVSACATCLSQVAANFVCVPDQAFLHLWLW